MRASVVSIVAIACACGKGKGKGKAADQAAAAAMHFDLGKTAMTSAKIVRTSDGGLQLWIANHEITCDEALQSMRVNVPHDDVALSADVSRRLAPGGGWSWELTNYWPSGAPETGELAPAQVKGDPAKDDTVEITFAYKDAKGTLGAGVCGDRVVPPDAPWIAKAKHASTATMTVAGQKVPIVAAWRFQSTTYLSTEPITCKYVAEPARLTLILDPSNGGWQLGGGWLPSLAAERTDALTITDGAHGDSADGPTVQLQLGGKATLGGYPVELAGTVEALDCKSRD